MSEKQPYLTLDNYSEYIERYRDSRPNLAFARAAHFAAGLLYRPVITFTHEAMVRGGIARSIAAEEALYLGSNHTTRRDQYIFLSVAQRVKQLRPLQGHANIPSKVEIANEKPAPVRLAAENVGARWTIRRKDVEKSDIEWTEEVAQQYREALQLGEDTDVYRMTQLGMHGAGFLEGQRNLTNFRTVQPFKIGIPRLLHIVSQECPVTFLPMGFCFDLDQTNYLKKGQPVHHATSPNVHIGYPIPINPDHSPEQIIEELHPAVQYCTTQAVERYSERVAA